MLVQVAHAFSMGEPSADKVDVARFRQSTVEDIVALDGGHADDEGRTYWPLRAALLSTAEGRPSKLMARCGLEAHARRVEGRRSPRAR